MAQFCPLFVIYINGQLPVNVEQVRGRKGRWITGWSPWLSALSIFCITGTRRAAPMHPHACKLIFFIAGCCHVFGPQPINFLLSCLRGPGGCTNCPSLASHPHTKSRMPMPGHTRRATVRELATRLQYISISELLSGTCKMAMLLYSLRKWACLHTSRIY